MNTILAIALGGALGSVMRHLLNGWVGSLAGGFPYGILACNVIGSGVMGLLVGLFAHLWEPSQAMRAFLTVGIVGGFTTFSTFSLDTVLLFERGAYGAAALYLLLSLVLSIGALVAGLGLMRLWLT